MIRKWKKKRKSCSFIKWTKKNGEFEEFDSEPILQDEWQELSYDKKKFVDSDVLAFEPIYE